MASESQAGFLGSRSNVHHFVVVVVVFVFTTGTGSCFFGVDRLGMVDDGRIMSYHFSDPF